MYETKTVPNCNTSSTLLLPPRSRWPWTYGKATATTFEVAPNEYQQHTMAVLPQTYCHHGRGDPGRTNQGTAHYLSSKNLLPLVEGVLGTEHHLPPRSTWPRTYLALATTLKVAPDVLALDTTCHHARGGPGRT